MRVLYSLAVELRNTVHSMHIWTLFCWLMCSVAVFALS